MNKKGFFFSVIAIGLVMVLIALFLTYQIKDTKTDISVDQVRISTMSSFADNVELQLIGEGFEISGRTALKEMEDIVKGGPITDPGNRMGTLMINGGGQVTDDKRFFRQYDSLVTLAARSGIDLEIKYDSDRLLRDIVPSDLEIDQEDPWGVVVETKKSARLIMKSENPEITIERDFTPKKRIEIREFQNDPLFLREGISIGIRTKDTIDSGDSDFPNSQADVKTVADGKTFIATSNGISYLDRFRNTDSASLDGNGIERLIVPGQNLPNEGPYSATDWQNFYKVVSSTCIIGLSNTGECSEGGYEEYRLDNTHRLAYNAGNTCECEDTVVEDPDLPDGDAVSQDVCNTLCIAQGATIGGCSATDDVDWCYIDPPGSACESTYATFSMLGRSCINDQGDISDECRCQFNNCCDGIGTCTLGEGCVA